MTTDDPSRRQRGTHTCAPCVDARRRTCRGRCHCWSSWHERTLSAAHFCSLVSRPLLGGASAATRVRGALTAHRLRARARQPTRRAPRSRNTHTGRLSDVIWHLSVPCLHVRARRRPSFAVFPPSPPPPSRSCLWRTKTGRREPRNGARALAHMASPRRIAPVR